MRPSSEETPATSRVLHFDFQGKRVRPATQAAQLNPPLSAEPADHASAIKQAIVRWLDEQ